jgi:hypothetical protein
MVVGIVGMAVSAAVILGVIVARGRRSRRRVVIEPVAVELTRSR